MSKIRVLPEALANKIAAGEVVERPASVVKELLENSLDAGALSLKIDVESGGRRLIRIQDDGEGMTPDDALLAFERHATSKLQRADDLMEIATLGFRGEALPSIASVSRLLLETRHESRESGTSVEINGARLAGVKEIARSRGTTLTMRDLFFNLPARKKFLKSDSTELGHIVNFVTQYALAHPEGRFVLRSAGSEVFNLQPVPVQRERVFQVFGGALLKQLVEIQSEVPVFYTRDDDAGEPGGHSERIRVHGFASKPEVHKLNRNSLYFFVNRRMVRDRIILHALNEAYRNILPAGIFPVVLLFIEMPLREVDVNVHPSKTEVRFRHQALLHDFLRDSVRKALMEARPQTPFPAARHARSAMGDSPFDATPIAELAFPGIAPRASSWSEAASVSGEPASADDRPFTLSPPTPAPANATLPFRSENALTISGDPSTTVAPPLSAASNAFVAAVLPARSLAAAAGVLASGESAEPVLVAQSQFGIVPLGQVDNSFIVAADGGALLLIDQHVAHERILFEKVLRQRSEGKVESQRLLLPLIIEIDPRQQVILENITPELAACGFEVEPFGRKTVAIKAAPAGLATTDVQHLLGELLEGLERETQAISLTRLREKIAASVACHAAIKVNMHLEHSKMVWLIDELQKTQYPMSCPHGRPIVLRYEKNEILKAFKRI
ncbi:MAG: DNA mismatch repair endonuclease MutL [Acidobacteria bacterium]|nr:DNA mismatch repair endonuclease MutL [Acidobacteriota bacterium]